MHAGGYRANAPVNQHQSLVGALSHTFKRLPVHHHDESWAPFNANRDLGAWRGRLRQSEPPRRRLALNTGRPSQSILQVVGLIVPGRPSAVFYGKRHQKTPRSHAITTVVSLATV